MKELETLFKKARTIGCLPYIDNSSDPVMATVDVSAFTPRGQNLKGLVANVFRKMNFESTMTLTLEEMPNSEEGQNKALSAHLTRNIDNELLPLIQRPAKEAHVSFTETSAEDIIEYSVPMVSTLQWIDKGGTPKINKLRERSKARATQILTEETEFCEKRHTWKWEEVPNGGQVPRKMDPIHVNLVEQPPSVRQ